MVKDKFEFKIISVNEPLSSDPFYTWLDKNADRRGSLVFMKHVLEYLGSLGFDKVSHRIEEEELQILQYVFEAWTWLTPYFGPRPFSDLFTAKGEGPGYYVAGNSNSRMYATGDLIKMVAESGWIYHVAPETTYFEITDNRLYAKYQQILGSRLICRISDLEVKNG